MKASDITSEEMRVKFGLPAEDNTRRALSLFDPDCLLGQFVGRT